MTREKKVVYRTLTENLDEGILACGYMPKIDQRSSQYQFTIQYYSCFLILEGSGTYISETGERIPMAKGDLVQRIPGVCHSTEIDGDGTYVEFFLSIGRPTYDLLAKLDLIPEESVCHVQHYQTMAYEFDKILEQLEKVSERELPKMLPEVQKIIIHLFQQTKTDNEDRKLIQLEDAAQMLSSNLEVNLSMEQVAEAVEMGYESFRRDFAGHYGVSPAKYRTKARMQQGAMMLLAGHSISDCAMSCGYSDVYAFSKQFKKSYGVAPGKYIKSDEIRIIM